MSWRTVARREALDVRRARGLWAVGGVLAAVATVATVLPAVVIGDALTTEQAIGFLVAPLKLVVALTALLAGHAAIAGARTGGQLKLVLGLPIGRTSLVIGAFVGRSVVVLGGVVAGVAVVAIALPVLYGDLPVGRLAAFAGLLGLYAVSVTGVAIGLSAATATRTRAAVAAVALFVLFEFFWGVLPAGVHYLVEGTLPGSTVPAWVVGLERAQPLSAFEAASGLVVSGPDQSVQLAADGASTGSGRPSLEDRLAEPTPFYLDPWAAVVTLVGWTIAPLIAGWYRFVRADL